MLVCLSTLAACPAAARGLATCDSQASWCVVVVSVDYSLYSGALEPTRSAPAT
jgi:hypothetical protein